MTDYVSKLGLDLETAGLSAGEKAMDSSTQAANRLEGAAQKVQTSFDGANAASSRAASSFQKQNEAINRLAMSSADADAGLRAMGGGLISVIQAQDRFTLALKEQSDLLGKSQADVLRYKAAQLGIGEAAEANIRKIEAFNNAARKPATQLGNIGAAAKLTANELLNVGYQFQDLGVQLASGANPLTAIIQQGSQLSGVFATAGARGISFGGVVSGIAESLGALAVALLPVIVTVAALGGAFLLANREMRKGVPDDLTKGLDLTEQQLKRIKDAGASTSVTLGDSFKGFFMTLGDYAVAGGNAVLKAFGTSWDEVKKVTGDALDWFVKTVSNTSATVYGLFKGGFMGFIQLWKTLPSVLGDVFVTTFNAIGKYVSGLFNQVSGSINSLIKSISSITGLKLPEIPVFNFQPMQNQFAGAGKKVIDAFTIGFTSGKRDALNAQSQFLKDWAANSEKAGRDRLLKVAGDAGKDSATVQADKLKKQITGADIASAALAGTWDGISKAIGRAIANVVKIPVAIAQQRASLDSFIQGYENYNKEAEAAMAKGGAAYDLFLAKQQIREALQGRITDLTESELDAAAKRLVIANQQYEADRRAVGLLSDNVVRAANDNLAQAADRFWYDFASGSRDTFKDLGKNLKDIFTEVAAKGLQAGFEPVLKWLQDSLTSVFSDVFSSIKGGFTDLLKKVGVLKTGADGAVSINTDTLIGKTVKAASTIYAGFQIGQAGANVFGLGGKSAANQQNSQAVGLAGAAIGSYFGGPIGSAIGSFIGSIIGGLLGPKSADNRAAANLTASGAISGSIFGKPTDETSQALTSAIGAIASGYDALKQLGGTINATITSLHIGNRDQSQATLSNGQTVNAGSVGDAADLANDALLAVLKSTTFATESLNKIRDAMISAGSSFDDTYKALSSVQSIMDSVAPATSEWLQKLKSIDDVFKPLIASTGQYSDALQEAYATAKAALTTAFNSSVTSQLVQLTSDAGSQITAVIEDIVKRWGDLNALGGDNSLVGKLDQAQIKALGQTLGTAIAQGSASVGDLNLALAQLQKEAKDLGSSSADVAGLFDIIKKSVASNFNADIKSQLLAIQSPEASQYAAILKAQADRISAATALGGDLNQVLALNAAQLTSFINGLSGSYDNIADLTKAFDALISAAKAAGQSTTALTDAYNANKATLAANFNTDLSSQIDQLSNPTLASLKALLKTQQDRLANATALGANIVAAERLNALETKDFFSKLTDQQKLSLGDYLGLIEDYTGKIGVVLTQLNDQLAARIDNFEQTKSGLEDTISAFKDIAKSLGDTRNSIIDQYSAATPLARITDLRSQFNELTNKAIGGDQTAAQALPDLANKLIDLSRGLYGSTTKFTADYDLVTKGLADAQASALTQVDVAQSQLDTLIKQYDILTQIKDALSSSDPNLDYLAQVIGTLDANNADIAAKLTQYLDLQAAQASSNFTAGQIATAAQTTIVQGTATQSPASTPDTAAQQIQVAYMEALVDATASGDATNGEKLDKIYQAITDLTIAINKAA